MIKKLPLNYNFFTKKIIQKLISANKFLAELNGLSSKIPNQMILINSLSLRESKSSSEIENIVTTYDELYKSKVCNLKISKETKEVENYNKALLYWFSKVKNNWIISNREILEIQSILEWNNAWFRTQSWTSLKNEKTWEIIYTPPQNIDEINILMKNLEEYLNIKDIDDLDPLIKMAIIHHQFESIHPFYDWNWRTWRIINILYLISQDLLNMPILYLSWYIINNKKDYYKFLQSVRDQWNWDDWILYILDAIEQTSKDTIKNINWISDLILEMKLKIRKDFPKFYSKDLLDILFSNPYVKIDFLVKWLWFSRQKASRVLSILSENWYLDIVCVWKNKYFINNKLFNILKNWA